MGLDKLITIIIYTCSLHTPLTLKLVKILLTPPLFYNQTQTSPT